MIRFTVAAMLLLIPGAAMAADMKAQARAGLERMSQADANGDGTVTRDEVKAARAKMFPRVDRDGNGVITDSDIPAWLSRMNSDISFPNFAKVFDVNKDRKITRDEWQNGGMQVFDMADTNRDNQVTAAEKASALERLK
jgi:Ca2+-binding EF-hand superfamily protein